MNNHLSYESIKAIEKFVEEFQNEFLEIFNIKFNEFANKAADEIYLKVIEKYIYLNNKENMKIDNMKDKQTLRKEAIDDITKSLKEKSKENFLSKFASQLYIYIASIFKERCERKLDEFIKNLFINNEANQFFKECDEFNENKELPFEKELKEYIDRLSIKEGESYQKALAMKEKLKCSSMGDSESCPSKSYGC